MRRRRSGQGIEKRGIVPDRRLPFITINPQIKLVGGSNLLKNEGHIKEKGDSKGMHIAD